MVEAVARRLWSEGRWLKDRGWEGDAAHTRSRRTLRRDDKPSIDIAALTLKHCPCLLACMALASRARMESSSGEQGEEALVLGLSFDPDLPRCRASLPRSCRQRCAVQSVDALALSFCKVGGAVARRPLCMAEAHFPFSLSVSLSRALFRVAMRGFFLVTAAALLLALAPGALALQEHLAGANDW